MAQHLSTLSENWHRVCDAKPHLRASVQAIRQRYRGDTWHVLSDASGNTYFRLNDGAYAFVGLLDGERTVAQAWEQCHQRLRDHAPTQGEVIQLLGQLYASNLLRSDLPADAEVMFERRRKRLGKEMRSTLSSFLFLRIPLIDPNRFLQATVGVAGWAFTPLGFVLWLALLAWGFSALTGHWGELLSGADPQVMLARENVVALILTFAAVKLIHELGHGYACAWFGRRGGAGGQVHSLGIAMMVLMPTPYVDASTSWLFRSRWHRATVGAAGMYFELAVAAVAALVWARVGDDHSAIRAVAYNVIFVAGVSTILFNANPLLRFDGYYILSDILEIANLYDRARQQLYSLVKRFALGVESAHGTANSLPEAAWLISYAIGSSVYRLLVTISIVYYLSGVFFIVGVALALLTLVAGFVVPLISLARYVLFSTELYRVRLRAVGVTGVLAAAIVVLVGFVPVPDRTRAQGVLEPRQVLVIHSASDGLVRSVLPSGTAVDPAGAPLVQADNARLVSELNETTASLDAALVRRQMADRKDPAAAQAMDQSIEALRQRRGRLEQELTELTVRAPFAGFWFTSVAEELTGSFVRRGEQLGVVADPRDLVVRVSADQDLGPRVVPEIGVGEHAIVEMRLRGRPEVAFTGAIERVLREGQTELPSAALGYLAGGNIAVDTNDRHGTRAAEPFFEVRVRPILGAAHPSLFAGQRVVVRFTMPSRPLAQQGWRWVQQAIQRRFTLPG